jgi:mono/diheme cytochrome c family protein
MRLRAAAILAAGLAVAGCGAVGHLGPHAGSVTRGKALFEMTTLPGGKAGCGTCHTLAAAGTTGTLGPNLDAAFGPDRCQKVGDESTIRDIVRGQIAYPDTDPGTGVAGMPSNLANGQNAKDIAAYVASVAGVIGKPGSPTPYWDCQTGAEVTG